MRLKPYYLGLVIIILLGLTASSALGVGGAGTVTGGTFPACVDLANTNTSVKIAGKQVNPGGLVRVPTGNTCLLSETTLNLNSYLTTILVSPGINKVASGTNLQNALTAATTGTLIKLEPGAYDLVTTPLTMKQGVDLEGSGEGLTTITSQVGGSSFPIPSTVVITNNSEIRFLTVTNNGNAARNGTILAVNVDKTAKLTNVTASTSATGSYNYGLYNSGSSPTILNATVAISAGSSGNLGIFNDNTSSPLILNSTITASGSGFNYAIYNRFTSSPTIQNSTVSATSNIISNNYAIYNQNSSAPLIQNSTITANGSSVSANFGIYNDGSSPTILYSTISGTGSTHNSINNFNAGTVKVGGSQLVGTVNSGVGFTCINDFNELFTTLTATCV